MEKKFLLLLAIYGVVILAMVLCNSKNEININKADHSAVARVPAWDDLR